MLFAVHISLLNYTLELIVIELEVIELKMFSSPGVETVSARGTATGGVDYVTFTNRVAVFGVSESTTTFTVTIMDDNVREDDETIIVKIVDTTNGIVDELDVAIITIEDDDDPSAGI